MKNMRRIERIALGLIIATFLGACGGSPASKPEAPAGQPSKPAAQAPTGTTPGAAPATPAQPAIPDDIQDAATAALGADTEVLVYGDLALTGKQEILAINRVKGGKDAKIPGNMVTRVAVLEKGGNGWKQVFLLDGHMKNEKGFLLGTPIAAVPSWRLQYEQHADKGLILYFTPLAQPAGGYVTTIGVRWNPKVHRYQALDRNYENFLGETPSLGTS